MAFRFVFISLTLLFMLACAKPANYTPAKPKPLGINLIEDISAFGDVMRDSARGDAGDILSDPALNTVKTTYGPSVISLKALPLKSALAVANIKPWSSWWYPKKDNDLFVDSDGSHSAALTKYDYIQQKRDSHHSSAAEFEQKNYNPRAAPWEGLCDAWALASISSPEPKNPVKINAGRGFSSDVTFSVGELKALLLKTYEATDDSGFKYYGQKFTGDINGWIYPDIFPEEFHRFIEIQLFQKKQPFIMDHDPGVEVWNVPVYKANYTLTAVPGEPNAVFVQMWLYSAESVLAQEKNFVGTREAIREYNYVLQGIRSAAGDLVIHSGYWVKGPDGVDSRKNHPDYMIQVPDPTKLVRKSWNPEINIELVDEILSKSY